MVTKQDAFYQTEAWAKGDKGQKLVARLLQEAGWYVLPSYDYSGQDENKAPRLEGQHETFVIPDLDIAMAGTRRWIEVKTKKQATWTRITQRLEHGFSRRHWLHYQHVQEITGAEVWLCVYEELSGDVLLGKIKDLAKEKREYRGTKMGQHGMVFFPRAAFHLWRNLHKS